MEPNHKRRRVHSWDSDEYDSDTDVVNFLGYEKQWEETRHFLAEMKSYRKRSQEEDERNRKMMVESRSSFETSYKECVKLVEEIGEALKWDPETLRKAEEARAQFRQCEERYDETQA